MDSANHEVLSAFLLFLLVSFFTIPLSRHVSGERVRGLKGSPHLSLGARLAHWISTTAPRRL